MIRTIEQIDADIAKLKAERESVIIAAKAPLNQRIAILLHDTQCRHNHTDACGWHYEKDRGDVHVWTGNSHSNWLAKADAMIAQLGRIGSFDEDTIYKVAQATV